MAVLPTWRPRGDSRPRSSSVSSRRSSRSRHQLTSLPGGNKAVAAFALALVAYTAQTELAQYVQSTLGYRKPYFSLYLGHSGFSIILPLHLLYLSRVYRVPFSTFIADIKQTLSYQLTHRARPKSAAADPGAMQRMISTPRFAKPPGGVERFGFPVFCFLRLIAALTVLITIPSLSWYIAVPLTSMADITAIYNTFSVWALVLSVYFLGEKWEKRKVFAVLLACAGVVTVAYGGGSEHRRKVPGTPSSDPTSGEEGSSAGETSTAALGNLLAFFGSIGYAIYEVYFKLYGAIEESDRDYVAVTHDRERRRSRGDISDEARVAGGPVGGSDRDTVVPAEDAASRTAEEVPFVIDDESDEEVEGDVEAQGRAEASTGGGEEPAEYLGARPSWSSPKSERRAFLGASSVDSPPGYHSTDSPTTGEGATSSPAQAVGLGIDGDRETPRTTLANGSVGSAIGKKSVRIGGEAIATVPVRGTADEDTDSVATSGTEDLVDEEERMNSIRIHRTRSSDALVPRRLSEDGGEEETTMGDADGGAHRRHARHGSSSSAAPAAPAPLPFGLHPNVMTSAIGFLTLSVLWVPLPVLDRLGWEKFELPPDLWTTASVLLVVIFGVFFNGAIMVLIACWGAVLASVSCLCTTVLVTVADMILGRGFHPLSLVGCAAIVGGFGLLVGGE